jgi:hypothetical protein
MSATPLSPTKESTLNVSTPSTARRYENYEVRTYTTTTTTRENMEGPASSPSPAAPAPAPTPSAGGQENVSPSKSRHSRVRSGVELSPLKLLSEPLDSVRNHSPDFPPGQSARSPRKFSPEKRFPVKVSNPMETPRPAAVSLDDAVRNNNGLNKAIEIFEDEQNVLQHTPTNSSPATVHIEPAHTAADNDDDDACCPDDTAISTFSTFSAVPNLTMLSKFGGNTRTGSAHEPGNTSNLLMDFAEQMRHPQQSPSKRGNLSPSRTTPNMSATPSRPLSNLIDFDIPPMPTPRSVPTITARELESLKSGFLSEISSLKASLSGKEAEVHSLKTAVGDAEKRVGESLEQLREERTTKEQLAADKESWESRGREMESVLRKVKQEIVSSDREKESLEQKLEESEKRREAAEMMHQEAESKMAGMRAGKESEKSSSPEKPSTREVEIAVERVARELHGLYKSKHETKVAALKKSYEARWEKKVRELEERIEELADDNEKLRIGRDATMTKVDPGNAEIEERKAQAVRDSAAIKELNADVQRLEAVVATVQRDNQDLRGMLEKERVEKGELVQLAEEMMNMQQSFVAAPQKQKQQQQQQQEQPQPQLQTQPTPRQPRVQPRQEQRAPPTPQSKTHITPRKPAARPATDGPRSGVGAGGIARPLSGIRAPTSGLRAPHERTKSAGGGLPRPGGVPRSGIMNSIEKMGNYRGRAEY